MGCVLPLERLGGSVALGLHPGLQGGLRGLQARVLMLEPGLGLLAGQNVPAVQVAVLLPCQAGAAAFTVAVDRAHLAFGQVGEGVPLAQFLEDRSVCPNAGKGLAADVAG